MEYTFILYIVRGGEKSMISKEQYLDAFQYTGELSPLLSDIAKQEEKYLSDELIQKVYDIYKKDYSSQDIIDLKKEYDELYDKVMENYNIGKVLQNTINSTLNCLCFDVNKIEDSAYFKNNKIEEKNEDIYKLVLFSLSIICSDKTPTGLKENVGKQILSLCKSNNTVIAEGLCMPLLKINNYNPPQNLLSFLLRPDDNFCIDILHHIFSKKNYRPINEIPQDLIDRIIEEVYSNKFLEKEKGYFSIFSYISDVDFVEKIMPEIQSNLFATKALLQNNILPDNIKERIWDVCECDPFSIQLEYITTPYIINSISEQIWDTLFTFENRRKLLDGSLPITEQQNTTNCIKMLQTLIFTEKLPESYQIDLANRLVSESKSCTSNNLESYLVKMGTSEEALRILQKLKSKTKSEITNNPHCPKEILNKKINNIFGKVSSLYKSKKSIQELYKQNILSLIHKGADISEKQCGTYLLVFGNDVKELLSIHDLSNKTVELFCNETIQEGIEDKTIKVPESVRLEAMISKKARDAGLNPYTALNTVYTSLILGANDGIAYKNIYLSAYTHVIVKDKKDMSEYIDIIKDSIDELGKISDLSKQKEKFDNFLKIKETKDKSPEIQKKIADLKNPIQKDTSFHIADFSYKLYANASALSDRIMSIADNYENIMEARNKEYCTFKNETIEK